MKENKGKEVVDKATRKEVQSQPRLTLPTSQQLSIQIQDIDSYEPARVLPSKTAVPASYQPSQRVPMNLLENQDLAWERFKKAVTSEDVAVCYDKSLKEFEHFIVHELFKVCNYFYLVLS